MLEGTKTISRLGKPSPVKFSRDPNGPTYDELVEREREKLLASPNDDEDNDERPEDVT